MAALAAPGSTPGVVHVERGHDALRAGDLAKAESHYRAAVGADPASADARINLGYALFALGRHDEAVPELRGGVALAPGNADAHYLLGASLLALHRSLEAVGALRTATSLQPGLVPAWRDLAHALHEQGRHDEAITVLHERIAVVPDAADLHLALGNVLAFRHRLGEAVDAYRDALRSEPGNAAILSSLAPALLSLGDVEGAAAAARQALAVEPGNLTARSNLLLALSSDAACSPEAYLREAMLYGDIVGQQVEASPANPALTMARERGNDTRLRVGFVSGDLRSHPVGYFLAPLIEHWDPAGMEAVAYNNHPAADAMTASLRKGFGLWRDVWGLDDDALARVIREDWIDVLVDLSGHTPGHRLPVFARRPAPMQVGWLGYWASTGLPAIDVVLADRASVPPESQRHFAETVVYLPQTRLCFAAPMGEGLPSVSALPALRNGFVTFGSFQRLAKINDAVVDLWAKVLKLNPSARMRLQSADFGDAEVARSMRRRFAAAGISEDRLELAGAMPRADYLAAHAFVDMILDTFPHAGATTTCEALWMGVPTLTLAGPTMLARQGASLLQAAGLDQWVAADRDAFAERATSLGGDLAALASLRARLRESVASSALMDAGRFARDFQDLLAGLVRPAARVA